MRKYGLSAEEVKRRMANENNVLWMLRRGELRMLINDDLYRDSEEEEKEGRRIFIERFGSEPRSEEDTYRFFVEQGLAYDEQSAKRAIENFNKWQGILYARNFFSKSIKGISLVEDSTVSCDGKHGFKIRKNEYSLERGAWTW